MNAPLEPPEHNRRLRRLIRSHLDFRRSPTDIAESLADALRQKERVPRSRDWARTILALIVAAGLSRSAGDLDFAARLISADVAQYQPTVSPPRS